MKKAQLLEHLQNNIVKIVSTYEPIVHPDGDREYSYRCLVLRNKVQLMQEDYTIRVVNEGAVNELAGYVGQCNPVNREQSLKAKLLELKKLGDIKGKDLSNLGIPFAELTIDGNTRFVSILDGETIILEG